MPAFYTLCPKHPQCGCSDASQCCDASPRAVARSFKLLTAALLPAVTLGAMVAAIAITLKPACAHAGSCGSCYINGSSGFVARKGKVQHCIPCHSVKPEQLTAWQPPVKDGPSRTGPGSRRNS